MAYKQRLHCVLSYDDPTRPHQSTLVNIRVREQIPARKLGKITGYVSCKEGRVDMVSGRFHSGVLRNEYLLGLEGYVENGGFVYALSSCRRPYRPIQNR
jgi:hypothetical protein